MGLSRERRSASVVGRGLDVPLDLVLELLDRGELMGFDLPGLVGHAPTSDRGIVGVVPRAVHCRTKLWMMLVCGTAVRAK
eukprot:13715018-Heterocapsa_arctica.AAC.1